MPNPGVHSEEFEETLVLEQTQWLIMLYNDDFNTFDWVIECLMKYCNHQMYQAEQCAWFVHNNGKYAVKYGDYDDLEPICTALCDQGLSAQLEKA